MLQQPLGSKVGSLAVYIELLLASVVTRHVSLRFRPAAVGSGPSGPVGLSPACGSDGSTQVYESCSGGTAGREKR